MKIFLSFLLVCLLVPAPAAGDCNSPIPFPDSATYLLVLKSGIAINDLHFLGQNEEGCLDSALLANEMANGQKMGEFEVALKTANQEVNLAFILRHLYKDPNANVYVCPFGDGSTDFRVLTSSAVKQAAKESGRTAAETARVLDTGFKAMNCRLIPQIEVKDGIDEIPARFLPYIITELPRKLGKPFPPEILPALNLSPPVETATQPPADSSPFPLM